MARAANSPWGKERKVIKCCFGCKSPKRYPGCGDHCKEYQEEKAQHQADKQREKEYKENHPRITSYDFNTNHR